MGDLSREQKSRNYSFTLPFGAALPDEDINFRDAARASSAAPTYFEPHVMGDHRFVDGSFVANYPLNILFKVSDLLKLKTCKRKLDKRGECSLTT